MEENNILANYESQRSWDRAQRGVLVQKVLCAFKDCSVDLIPFEEVRTRLHLTQKICRGVQNIDLDSIRGSVGRYQDFTSAFLPRKKHLRQRWQRVKGIVFSQGMPPIELYQVGEAYFVVDGNHRVSIARQTGWKTIEAYVCEFLTPMELSSGADLDEVIIAEEYAEFLNKTRLDKILPDQEIIFTSPGRYSELEIMINDYKETLEGINGKEMSDDDALRLWFDEVYIPAANQIKNNSILEHFPKRTDADLFIWIWKHQNILGRKYPSSSFQKD